MFDIGFAELLVIAVLGLIIIGPQRLPEVIRSISLWVGRLRRSFSNLKGEMEKEFQLDEIRRQLHNEEIMQRLSNTQDNTTASNLNSELHSTVSESATESDKTLAVSSDDSERSEQNNK